MESNLRFFLTVAHIVLWNNNLEPPFLSCTCRQGYRVNQPFTWVAWLGGPLFDPARLCAAEFWEVFLAWVLKQVTITYQRNILSLPFSPASRNMFMAKLVGKGKYVPFSWEPYGYLDSMPRWCKQAVTFSSTIIGGHHSNLSEGSGFSPSQRSTASQPTHMQGTPMRNKAKKWGLIEGTTMVKNPLLRLYFSWGVPNMGISSLVSKHQEAKPAIADCSLQL